jgi:hypothetical protein
MISLLRAFMERRLLLPVEPRTKREHDGNTLYVDVGVGRITGTHGSSFQGSRSHVSGR